MSRILHVSDLHSHKPFYQWILEQSNKYDILCISGDLIGSNDQEYPQGLTPNSLRSMDEQINFVLQWLEKLTKPTFICSGNHDVESDLNELDFDLNCFTNNIDDIDEWEIDVDYYKGEACSWFSQIKNKKVYSDNAIETINGICFGVIPYQYSGSLERFKRCDIILHHEPPQKTQTAIQNGIDLGSYELYLALKSKEIVPKYLLCGHVHNPNQTEAKINLTRIYNPGIKFTQAIPCYKQFLFK